MLHLRHRVEFKLFFKVCSFLFKDGVVTKMVTKMAIVCCQISLGVLFFVSVVGE